MNDVNLNYNENEGAKTAPSIINDSKELYEYFKDVIELDNIQNG